MDSGDKTLKRGPVAFSRNCNGWEGIVVSREDWCYEKGNIMEDGGLKCHASTAAGLLYVDLTEPLSYYLG